MNYINILKQFFYNSPVYPAALNIQQHTITAKADSGVTAHYLKDDHRSTLKKMKSLVNGPSAMLPNNVAIRASHSGTLPFSTVLSKAATKALVFPGLANESLLSIGQLCDDNCIALFTKHSVYI